MIFKHDFDFISEQLILAADDQPNASLAYLRLVETGNNELAQRLRSALRDFQSTVREIHVDFMREA